MKHNFSCFPHFKKTSSVTLDFIGFDFEIGCPVELTFHTFHLSLFSFQFSVLALHFSLALAASKTKCITAHSF
jgi:hypothetical protein